MRSAPFSLSLLFLVQMASAAPITFTFENADLHTVVKAVSKLTQTTFLFDPEQVKGKITLLAPEPVSPAQALQLLQSALAVHGYTMLRRAESTWIVPSEQAMWAATAIEVVPLQYARAEEVAHTLSQVIPYGVQIVPYPPLNSLLISGDSGAVEKLIGIVRGKEKAAEGP
jgi:general secretion pathway protein D